jgi:hypothetical protein
MVQGRQAFSKTGQTRAQRGLLRPSSQALSTFGTLWQAPVPSQLTKSRWVEAKAEAALFPQLNEPKQRFSWFKATFPMVDRRPAHKAKKCTRFSSLVAVY